MLARRRSPPTGKMHNGITKCVPQNVKLHTCWTPPNQGPISGPNLGRLWPGLLQLGLLWLGLGSYGLGSFGLKRVGGPEFNEIEETNRRGTAVQSILKAIEKPAH